jgi:hypothetical protein
MWLGWTQQAWPGHWPKPVTQPAESSCMREFVSRVHEQCEGN